ncbi:unnamed protein product [Caenorhabditis angaria]|uniref:Dynactin subunit 4 n=1 Tax=Caenorhabditis angaria TaxID=860376 RepID=A0A9P1N0T8_9PELO|nr:unnamed protein product [Caenorhabditis angaria]
MSALLQSFRVKYECSCGKFRNLSDLHFCRQCFKIKCEECACVEIDMLYCARCLEASTVPEARLKKNQCFNCVECPMCMNILSGRTENDKFFLICQACSWQTREAGIEDRDSAKKWPVYENEITNEMNDVMNHMKKLEMIQNAPKDSKNRKISKGWSAHHLPNKFGLQSMVEKKRQMMFPDLTPLSVHEPEEPLSLEEELENRYKSKNLRTADQIIRQPLASSDQPLFPVRVPLQGRTSIRCDECERTLVKRDYGVVAYKFKISAFAREYVPDIRISRPVQFENDKTSHVLLTITNLSSSPIQLKISPQEKSRDDLVECSTPPVNISIPCSIDTDTAGVPAEKSDVIVFRQHNRIGLNFDFIPNQSNEHFLALSLEYTQNGSFGLLADKSQNTEEASSKVLKANVIVQLHN